MSALFQKQTRLRRRGLRFLDEKHLGGAKIDAVETFVELCEDRREHAPRLRLVAAREFISLLASTVAWPLSGVTAIGYEL